MDTSNLEDLQEFVEGLDKHEQANLGKGTHQPAVEYWQVVQLFGDYREPGSKVDPIVRDPYYGWHIRTKYSVDF